MAASFPPTEATAAQLTATAALAPDVKVLLISYKVPWFIQGALAADGYTSMDDLADRWTSKEHCREHAATDYAFADSQNGFDARTSLRASIKLAQATEDARTRVKQHTALLSAPGSSGAKDIITAAVRESLECTYASKNLNIKPPLEEQGSDTLLGIQFKDIQNSRLGYRELRAIVPYLPDANLCLVRRTVRSASGGIEGTVQDFQEEEINEPSSMDGARKLWRIFRTTLLMCVDAQPQVSGLQVEHSEVDEFYQFLQGPSIAKKDPPPSVKTLVLAERAAWREITILMHRGSTLKQALVAIQADSLFWTREVYDKSREPVRADMHKPPQAVEDGSSWYHWDKGKGKGKSYYDYQGKGKGKGYQPYADYKGKGKGKAAWTPRPVSTVAPDMSKWAQRTPNNKEYCRNYQTKGCNSQCGRSHNCPVLMPDGIPCNSNAHLASGH